MPENSGIAIKILTDQEVLSFPEENITGIILRDTESCTSTVAYVAPGQAQTLHVHDRPDNGDVIMFIYRGAFRVVSRDYASEVHDTGVRGPVYIEVGSGTPVSIENRGDDEVAFFTVFAPGFRDGEIRYLN